jgi:acyl-CoA synthetase (AMP-forming)/AMP-acid ligase II
VQAAVVGKSVDGDEEVIAFAQLLPGSLLTTAELAEYASRHLAMYKRPSEIIIVPAMPLTPTGKIAKTELARRLEYSLQPR